MIYFNAARTHICIIEITNIFRILQSGFLFVFGSRCFVPSTRPKENCSHVRGATPKSTLILLDSAKKRDIHPIGQS